MKKAIAKGESGDVFAELAYETAARQGLSVSSLKRTYRASAPRPSK